MPKRPSAYYRPQSVEEALRLLARPDTVPLAGGTTLLAGDITSAVVDLQDLGLNQIHPSQTSDVFEKRPMALHMGAMARLVELSDWLTAHTSHSPAPDPQPLLLEAARRAGPNTFRHAATVGGVIASRPPDSEFLAALLVLEAELTLQRLSGPASLSLSDYLTAAERPAGLITEIVIPWQEGQGACERVARTPADYPIVSITAWQPTGATPRLAATGIDERPLRLWAAESALAAGITTETIEATAAAAKAACRHAGDFRGDTSYRAEMAAVLAGRVLRAIGNG
ncbi:MAG: FAD binding domain-containing protein [Chloroflexota bacterium]